LIAAIIFGMGMATAAAGQTASQQGLGSANDYLRSTPDSADTFDVPLLGIAVNNGADHLHGGHPISGVEILTVMPSGPGAAAGLQGRREGTRAALTIGLLAGAMLFPPAMLGVVALQQSGIGASRELIIAVDGQRTRDVSDLGEAMENAEAGEIVYLTVLSGGRREQVPVELPVGQLR
jgi:S1-C subfamily serine protease